MAYLHLELDTFIEGNPRRAFPPETQKSKSTTTCCRITAPSSPSQQHGRETQGRESRRQTGLHIVIRFLFLSLFLSRSFSLFLSANQSQLVVEISWPWPFSVYE